MLLTVNGKPQDVPEGTTVGELIRLLSLDRGACAAEVNAALVPKPRHGAHVLVEGDRVELVTLVGGG